MTTERLVEDLEALDASDSSLTRLLGSCVYDPSSQEPDKLNFDPLLMDSSEGRLALLAIEPERANEDVLLCGLPSPSTLMLTARFMVGRGLSSGPLFSSQKGVMVRLMRMAPLTGFGFGKGLISSSS
mmetsp:Transcript_11220/g.25730  ORF Transcript_11220/g.25730 Transcript_11220/m.25730 type:complete len:127 (-) Transcript_11220:745-1125(-)